MQMEVEPCTPRHNWTTMEYRVDHGDTISRLAKRFDMSREELADLNNLNTEELEAASPIPATAILWK